MCFKDNPLLKKVATCWAVGVTIFCGVVSKLLVSQEMVMMTKFP